MIQPNKLKIDKIDKPILCNIIFSHYTDNE